MLHALYAACPTVVQERLSPLEAYNHAFFSTAIPDDLQAGTPSRVLPCHLNPSRMLPRFVCFLLCKSLLFAIPQALDAIPQALDAIPQALDVLPVLTFSSCLVLSLWFPL